MATHDMYKYIIFSYSYRSRIKNVHYTLTRACQFNNYNNIYIYTNVHFTILV